MSAQFLFLAGLLTGVAATTVASRLGLGRLRWSGWSRPSRTIALTVGGIAIFTLVAVGLYALLGSARPAGSSVDVSADVSSAAQPGASRSTAGQKALSMEAATAQLEARLSREGGSDSDWQLLAQSYEFLGRTADAERAKAHRLDPNSSAAPAALPVGEVARLIGDSPSSTESPGPSESPSRLDGSSVAQGLTGQPSGGGSISGTVSVDNGLMARIPQGATLFIYAKAADSPGPPLAVLRTTAGSWPVSFRLDDSLAMIPSRRLSQFQQVIVEARISRTGQATPATGDLYVTSGVVSPVAGKKLALVIAHEIG